MPVEANSAAQVRLGNEAWSGASSEPDGRIEYLERLLDRTIADHSLRPKQERTVRDELRRLRNMLSALVDRDGGRLNAEDRAYLLERLDVLRQEIGWSRTKGS
jgi:hypothetical protein